MMNITLVRVGKRNFLNPSISQPLGIMYLASYLRKFRENKDRIRIIDMKLKNYSVEVTAELILDQKPDIVGLSCFTPDGLLLNQLARQIRKKGFAGKIVAGGPHPSSYIREVLEDRNIDLSVIGEGEDTFLQLVEHFDSKKDFREINGIAYFENSILKVNHKTNYIENLDNIPFPAWDLIEFNEYFNHITGVPLKEKRYMQIFTSRGCPYGCIFCHNIFGKKFRTRSAENILHEIKTLVNDFGIKELLIMDDIFNLNKERAEKILDGIKSLNKNLHIVFPTGLRGDILSEDLVKKMREAGTYYAVIAIESGSQKMQKYMKKNLRLDRVEAIINTLTENKIFVNSSLLFGFPEETIEDIKETFKFVRKTKLDMIQPFILNPFKGTEVFSLINRDITESYDLYNYYVTRHNYTTIPSYKFYTLIWINTIYFYIHKLRFIKTIKNAPRRSYLLKYILLFFGRIIFAAIKIFTKNNYKENVTSIQHI